MAVQSTIDWLWGDRSCCRVLHSEQYQCPRGHGHSGLRCAKKWNYGWFLNNVGLNYQGPLTRKSFFSSSYYRTAWAAVEWICRCGTHIPKASNAILYMGLEDSWILLSMGVLPSIPLDGKGQLGARHFSTLLELTHFVSENLWSFYSFTSTPLWEGRYCYSV